MIKYSRATLRFPHPPPPQTNPLTPAGVIVSDYPSVQVTPGGNLKLVSSYPLWLKLPPQFYRLTFNDNNKLYISYFHHMALGHLLETL